MSINREQPIPRNLLEVRVAIERLGLAATFSAELVTAINAIGKVEQEATKTTVDAGLEAIPLEPQSILERLNIKHGVRAGFDPKQWRRYGNLTRKALKLSGAFAVVTSRHMPLSSSWLRLVQWLPRNHPVRLLARWAEKEMLKPEAISSSCLGRFEAWLITWLPRRAARRRIMSAVRGWNEACSQVRGWPQVTLMVERRRSDHYSLPLDSWPTILRSEIAEIFARWMSPSLTTPRRVLSEGTAKSKRMLLYRLLNAHIAVSGAAPNSVISTAAIVDPRILTEILIYIQTWTELNRYSDGLAERWAAANLVLKLSSEEFLHLISPEDRQGIKAIAQGLGREKARRWPNKSTAKKK